MAANSTTNSNIFSTICEHPPKGWESLFHKCKHILAKISERLDNEENTYGEYYPLVNDIFNAFIYTPLDEVKVVILGQDPYYQTVVIDHKRVPRPVGLSFSVRKGDKIPSSLQNIYKEIKQCYPAFNIPKHGDLTSWAKQGILMLNYSLTVRKGTPNTHVKIWEEFINEVFLALSEHHEHIVYVLWGSHAQKYEKKITSGYVLKSAHPSGLSAHRGFYGNRHFILINEKLGEWGCKPIEWQLDANDGSKHVSLPYGSVNIPQMIPTMNDINMPPIIQLTTDHLIK